MHLVYYAAWFLKWEKRCSLILTERSPRAFMAGRPDVLGILPSRYLIEIEIKCTLSDFRANKNKRHILMRNIEHKDDAGRYRRAAPRHYFFLVPQTLADKVAAELPDGAGLLVPLENRIGLKVLKEALPNRESAKLTIKECSKLLHLAGNQMVSTIAGNVYLKSQCEQPLDSTSFDEFFTNSTGYQNFQI